MSARPRRPVPSLPPAPPPLLRAHRPAHLGGVLRSRPILPAGPQAASTSRRLGYGSRASGCTFSFLKARCGPLLSPQSEVSEGRQGRGRSTGDEESLAVLRR